MRTPARLVSLLSVALAAGACSGNDPQPPRVIQGGWSWNPAVAGDRPLPVVWTAAGAPQQLPLLVGGDCGTSGSVQAIANAGGAPLFAGISVACNGGVSTMTAVTWENGVVTPLPVPPPYSQAAALAVAWFDDMTYVAGASGDAFPLPTLWKNGAVVTRNPTVLLPPWSDSGVITSLVVTSKYAIAAGIVHSIGSVAPAYQGVVWILDPDFTSLNGALLVPPSSMGTASFLGTVAMTFDGLQVYSAAGVEQDGQEKPVFWLDDVAYSISGDDPAVAPWGVATGIALVDSAPYVTGYHRPSSPTDTPQPIIWTSSATQALPTADATPVGSGEAIALWTLWAFVSGESLGRDPTAASRWISVPELWVNGGRQDLAGLVAPGSGPTLSTPLYGWWKVPGTSPAEDWPWPGGFGEVLRHGPVSAAGSGVARSIVALPP
jgi:hypothetical protein